MNCPNCGAKKDKIKVIDSRSIDGGIKRRRECEECNHRFTTREQLDTGRKKIIKRDNNRQNFDVEKLRTSIERAAFERPISAEQIEQIVIAIQSRLSAVKKSEVHSFNLAQWVMSRLQELDDVSYVRYAAPYHRFKEAGVLPSGKVARSHPDQLDMFVRDSKDEQ